MTSGAGWDRPRHRVRPRSGWVNDPNGPVRWQGRYHLFFQYNPHAPVHDRICWGHASSADLVSWRDEPVALTPGPGAADAWGCWSGCVVPEGEVATAVYTGAAEGPETASICLATSTDEHLRRWDKLPDPVAVPPADLDLLAYRDPFVFTFGGRRYAVVGAGGTGGGRAMVLLYECDDLRVWNYLGVLLDTSDAVAAEVADAEVWECPQLVELDGRWVLIVSLVRGTLDRVAYLVGDLVESGDSLSFTPVSAGLVDHGHDFYAPAALALPDRTLLWGWTWEDRPTDDEPNPDWAGALTLTRELGLTSDGLLHSRPVPELATLHDGLREAVLDETRDRIELPAGPLDLAIRVRPGRARVVTLDLLATLRLTLDFEKGRAALSREVHDAGRRTWVTEGPLGDLSDPIDRSEISGGREVRIVVDGSVVEVYVDRGPTFTERVYRRKSTVLAMSAVADARCDVAVRRLRSPEESPPAE